MLSKRIFFSCVFSLFSCALLAEGAEYYLTIENHTKYPLGYYLDKSVFSSDAKAMSCTEVLNGYRVPASISPGGKSTQTLHWRRSSSYWCGGQNSSVAVVFQQLLGDKYLAGGFFMRCTNDGSCFDTLKTDTLQARLSKTADGDGKHFYTLTVADFNPEVQVTEVVPVEPSAGIGPVQH